MSNIVRGRAPTPPVPIAIDDHRRRGRTEPDPATHPPNPQQFLNPPTSKRPADSPVDEPLVANSCRKLVDHAADDGVKRHRGEGEAVRTYSLAPPPPSPCRRRPERLAKEELPPAPRQTLAPPTTTAGKHDLGLRIKASLFTSARRFPGHPPSPAPNWLPERGGAGGMPPEHGVA